MSTEKLEALRAQNGINGRHLFGGQNFLPGTGATITDVVLMKQGLAIEDVSIASHQPGRPELVDMLAKPLQPLQKIMFRRFGLSGRGQLKCPNNRLFELWW